MRRCCRTTLAGAGPENILLTRTDFGSAVKEALRHYPRADLLAGNPLLHARALTRAGPATPRALKALLAETAETLFANERDQRLYRVLDLTYFNPAPKQMAVTKAASSFGVNVIRTGC